MSVPGSLVEGREVTIDWGDGQISVGEVILGDDGRASIRVNTILAETITYFATIRFIDVDDPTDRVEIPLEILTIPVNPDGGWDSSLEPVGTEYDLSCSGSFAGIWISVPDYSRVGGKPDSCDPVDPLEGQESPGETPDTELETPLKPPTNIGDPLDSEPIELPDHDSPTPRIAPTDFPSGPKTSPGPTSESEFRPGEVQSAPLTGSLDPVAPSELPGLGNPHTPAVAGGDPDTTAWWLEPVSLTPVLVPGTFPSPGSWWSLTASIDKPEIHNTSPGNATHSSNPPGSTDHVLVSNISHAEDLEETWPSHVIEVGAAPPKPLRLANSDPNKILANYTSTAVPAPEFSASSHNEPEKEAPAPVAKWRTRAAILFVSVGAGMRVVRGWLTVTKLEDPPVVIAEPRQVPEVVGRSVEPKSAPRT